MNSYLITRAIQPYQIYPNPSIKNKKIKKKKEEEEEEKRKKKKKKKKHDCPSFFLSQLNQKNVIDPKRVLF